MDYLGIDYGTKRIGLSVGDSVLNFVVPIKAIRVTGKNNTAKKIAEIVKLREIHKIIIGYPINMDDTIGTKAKEVDYFVHLLEQYITIPMERMDERLTSENVYDLRKRSSKNRQNLRKSGAIDSAAAVLILQDYFDRHHANVSD
ncbi:MAG: Holliday junction resolvase RuvX [Puniceicoccales bacterium]|jgi:putative Holliday junction resolvase|nr:Holliday junction resolvase RuvX [Puniceicoccales bacterium]